MSQLTNNIQFHSLIEKDKKCLYCKHNISKIIDDIDYDHYKIDNYICSNCHEIFSFHYRKNQPCRAFEFSCKDMKISIYYETENFSYGFIKKYYEKRQWSNNLDLISFDFSNKEKLYNKLKTYLVFS